MPLGHTAVAASASASVATPGVAASAAAASAAAAGAAARSRRRALGAPSRAPLNVRALRGVAESETYAKVTSRRRSASAAEAAAAAAGLASIERRIVLIDSAGVCGVRSARSSVLLHCSEKCRRDTRCCCRRITKSGRANASPKEENCPKIAKNNLNQAARGVRV
jgi:hypothetical protein